MSVGTLVVRVVLVGIVPVLVSLVGREAGSAVWILSILAAIFECVATGLNDMSNTGKKGGRKEKSIRPLKSFPLQLAVLYIVQLWFLLLSTAGASPSPLPDVADGIPGAMPGANAAPAPLPPLPGQFLGSQVEVRDFPKLPAHAAYVVPGNTAAEPVAVAAPVAQPAAHPDRPRPWAKTIAEGFILDATPEELAWSPKTISVVLPCAEERDFALKTVQAVFRETPADVLHEIVVVDDGSNPPLSQTHLTPDIQKQYKVLIKRHEETVGLIGAKKTGGDAATGDIIVFFDCHVGPQTNWHQDFIRLISENYRRMVIPQITSLNIEDWTQIGAGGGMSKCYVTWDGDFKWGGTDDMYMGMLSGGLAGLSKRWWIESGGYDDQMLGWGGENIDQGIRMWVCGGEIVAAPNSQVAHMWRTGDSKTNARYKHVGDTSKNRARAINAWMGEFTAKLDDFPNFASRKQNDGPNWFGDMSNFQKVRDNLQGCRPFAWYLRRFKTVYEDAGIVPDTIFMLRDETSQQCLLFQGSAGTSGQGREGIILAPCDEKNHRFFWHLGNRSPKNDKCCSGLRAWNTEQCFEGGQSGGVKAVTGICEVSGRNSNQHWKLHSDGQLRKGDRCMGSGNSANSLQEAPCFSFRSKGGARFTKQAVRTPIETTLYRKAQQEHPATFAKLNAMFKATDGSGPKKCTESGVKCMTLQYADGSKKCVDEDGSLSDEKDSCIIVHVLGKTIRNAESGDCLDTKSDSDPQSYLWYSCHGGPNQNFDDRGSGKYCASQQVPNDACFETLPWP